ncbi:MAG: UDP-N-acetylmuramoyl-tripeptide--D-alanyl-D-alanine ligase [Candidatus Zixiibacteriota bacterium]
MISLQFDELAHMLGGSLVRPGTGSTRFTGVSIDSRTIHPGELFIAIRGERVDGHAYIAQALDKKAAGILIETSSVDSSHIPDTAPAVAVKSSHDAMMELASRYRDSVPAKYVGITGSNGKTTTKETTFALLAAVEKDVYRSAGNLNNLYGMPLALFAMPRTTRVAILEMGISSFGEMTRLTKTVKPDVALFTNIGASHLEFLGSLEGVARAKFEMVAEGPSDLTVIINADDPYLAAEAAKHGRKIVTYGINNPADFHPTDIRVEEDGSSTVSIEGHQFHTTLFGRHQIYNILAGYAVARVLGYDFAGVDTRSIQFTSAPMRGQVEMIGGVNFIADCYNANPDSVKLGLQSLANVPGTGRRVLILGDMLELGEKSGFYHREIGTMLSSVRFDLALLVGPMSLQTMTAAIDAGIAAPKLKHFAAAASCAQQIADLLKPGDLVYVKGSRGVGLEVILNAFRKAKVVA